MDPDHTRQDRMSRDRDPDGIPDRVEGRLDLPTAATPEDLIAAVPHLLGFWPDRSAVLVAVDEKHPGQGTIEGLLRFDLPAAQNAVGPLASDGAWSLVAQFGAVAAGELRTLCAALAASSGPTTIRTALLLLFTGVDWADDRDPGYDQLFLGLSGALAAAGFPLSGAWWIGSRYWRDYLCREERCCPLSGRSLEVVRQSRLNAELIFRGSSYQSRQEDARTTLRRSSGLPDFPDLRPGYRRTARAAFLRALPKLGPLSSGSSDGGGAAEPRHDTSARRSRDEVLQVWQQVLDDGAELRDNPQRLGYLAASLADRGLRDTVLIATAGGFAAALGCLGAEHQKGAGTDSQEATSSPKATTVGTCPMVSLCRPSLSVGELLLGVGDAEDVSGCRAAPRQLQAGKLLTPPDQGRLARCATALRLIAALPGSSEEASLVGVGLHEPVAAALSILGWLEWCQGRTHRAREYLDAALREIPGYRLAEMFSELLERGLTSAWARGHDANDSKFSR